MEILGERHIRIVRNTKETKIALELDLDSIGGSGHISTGLPFFDHMLDQIPNHGGVALSINAKGDLQVDEHHTIEDVGIVFGEAINAALGSKLGVARYGFVLPMDDCDAAVLLDFGGRIDFKWNAEFKREKSAMSRPRCSAISSSRSAPGQDATCTSGPRAGTSITRPRQSSKPSPGL